MGAAVVMAMFASQELGPMATPVTKEKLAGRWMMEDRDRTGKIVYTFVNEYKVDGTLVLRATITETGKTLISTGRYTLLNGELHQQTVNSSGEARQSKCFIFWTSAGHILCTATDPNRGTTNIVVIRVRDL